MQEVGREAYRIQVRENMTEDDFCIAMSALVQGFAARSGKKSGEVMRKVIDAMHAVGDYHLVQREA